MLMVTAKVVVWAAQVVAKADEAQLQPTAEVPMLALEPVAVTTAEGATGSSHSCPTSCSRLLLVLPLATAAVLLLLPLRELLLFLLAAVVLPPLLLLVLPLLWMLW